MHLSVAFRADRTVVLALLLTACSDGVAPRPPRVRGVRIEAGVASLQAGVTLPLRAVVDAEAGADTAVRWTSVPSEAGAVSPFGVVTSCYPGGELVVTATSVADPTKAATVSLAVTAPLVPWAGIGPIARPGAGWPAAEDVVSRGAVAGDVELVLRVNAGVLACRAVERVDVRLRGPGIDSVLARIAFAPPFTDMRVLRVPLRAGLLPNGAYELGGAVYVSGVTRPGTLHGGAITVRNPAAGGSPARARTAPNGVLQLTEPRNARTALTAPVPRPRS